ncbi:MAG: hypothetical protein ACYCO3_16450, partial [Mycobacteriales bacterium]
APAVPETDSNAITSFVLAILAYVFFPIGIVLAVPALVYARRGRHSIAGSDGWRIGAGFVTAARVLAQVFLVLWGFGLLVFLSAVVGSSVSVHSPAVSAPVSIGSAGSAAITGPVAVAQADPLAPLVAAASQGGGLSLVLFCPQTADVGYRTKTGSRAVFAVPADLTTAQSLSAALNRDGIRGVPVRQQCPA